MQIPYSPKSYLSFNDYLSYVEDLVRDNKTSGSNQSESLIKYTKLNQHRMKRLVKHFDAESLIEGDFSNTKPQIWWILTEAWCGDAAQNIPIIAGLADEIENVEVRIIFRDENPEMMDQFLTNGGRSIPKLIATDESGEVLFTWGPRPKNAQKIMSDFLLNPEGKSKDEVQMQIQKWYNDNSGRDLISELIKLMSQSEMKIS